MATPYRPPMSHEYQFQCGDKVRIISGKHSGATGIVVSLVFQRSEDYPDELTHGFHVTLDDGSWITVKRDQCSTIVWDGYP